MTQHKEEDFRASKEVQQREKDKQKQREVLAQLSPPFEAFGLQPAEVPFSPSGSDATPMKSGPAIFPMSTMWGSRVTRIFDVRLMQSYNLKHALDGNSKDSDMNQKACTYSTALSKQHCYFAAQMLPGAVEFLTFQPVTRGAQGGAEVRYTEKGESWVCSRWLDGTMDLQSALDKGVLSKEGVRLEMARALGILHNSKDDGAEASGPQLAPVSMRKRWVGGFRDRSEYFLENPELPQDLQEFIQSITRGGGGGDITAARVDSLPSFPCTGDLQSKNMLYKPPPCFTSQDDGLADGGTTTVINTEILVNMARSYDLLWLLLLNDKAEGMAGSDAWVETDVVSAEKGTACQREEEAASFILGQRFAQAMLVYSAHCPNHPMTAEEVDLFPLMAMVKLCQCAALGRLEFVKPHFPQFTDLSLHGLGVVKKHQDLLRSILRDTCMSRRPYSHILTCGRARPIVSLDDLSHDCILRHVTKENRTAPAASPLWHEYANCRLHFQHRLASSPEFVSGAPQGKVRGCVLYYNGTFAPAHTGHLEAALMAAEGVERDMPGVMVVGIAFGLCHQSYATRKMGKKSMAAVGAFLNDGHRVALLDMLIHCSTSSAAKRLREKFNPFVDTSDAHLYPASESKRYEAVAEKTIQSLSDLTVGNLTVGSPLTVCVMGEDLVDSIPGFIVPSVQRHQLLTTQNEDGGPKVGFVIVRRKEEDVELPSPITNDLRHHVREKLAAGGAPEATPLAITLAPGQSRSSSEIREAWMGLDSKALVKTVGHAGLAFWIIHFGRHIPALVSSGE